MCLFSKDMCTVLMCRGLDFINTQRSVFMPNAKSYVNRLKLICRTYLKFFFQIMTGIISLNFPHITGC